MIGTFFAWFLAAIIPLTGRVLVGLGLTAVSLVGVQATASTLSAKLLDSIGTLPVAALQLAGLGGAWEGLSIILAAVTFCVSWHLLTGASKYVYIPPALRPPQ